VPLSDKPQFANTGACCYRRRATKPAIAAMMLSLTITIGACPAFAQSDGNSHADDQRPDIAALKETAATYRAALQQYQREREPQAWAKAQHDLADALVAVAGRETGTKRLQEAVAAYRAALKERTRERAEQDWAITQSQLGVALTMLGEREAEPKHLLQAVDALRAAVVVCGCDSDPLARAKNYARLGRVLYLLGERKAGVTQLEEAEDAYRLSLRELTHENSPEDWARAQIGFSNVLFEIGKREQGIWPLREAEKVLRAIQQQVTRERSPQLWAKTQVGMGCIFAVGSSREPKMTLTQAIDFFRSALDFYASIPPLPDKAIAQYDLGVALTDLGIHGKDTVHLQQAVDIFHTALKEDMRQQSPLIWAKTEAGFGRALSILGERTQDADLLQRSISALETATELFRLAEAERDLALAEKNIATANDSLKKLNQSKPPRKAAHD